MINVSDHLKTLYEDTMDVIETVKTKDATTGINRSSDSTKYSGIPCRISFAESSSAADEDAPKLEQSIKVFCNPGYVIKAGSKLKVTRSGKAVLYKCSSKPAVYTSHQEITVKLIKEYA